MKKVRFLIGIWCIPRFRCNLAPHQQKKRKPKDSILPRWGEKNDRVCFPQKESFGKSKFVFMFKVGAKIDADGDPDGDGVGDGVGDGENRYLTILCAK